MNMAMNGHYYSKEQWRRIVWQTIWAREDEDCILLYKEPKPDTVLFKVIGKTYYLTWWVIADIRPDLISMCEDMAKLVCDTSLLKNNDYSAKRRTFGFKVCSRCDLGIIESAKHFIMQCPF